MVFRVSCIAVLGGLAVMAAPTAMAGEARQPAGVPTALVWKEGRSVPAAKNIPRLEQVEFHVIKPFEPDRDGYRFLHGVALAWHNGRLFASFGHNQGPENTATEEARYRVSDDGGRTWSDVRTIEKSDDYAVSHGVFLETGDALWAFHGSFTGTLKNVCTRAYVLNDATGDWEPRGVVVEGGFWPLSEPVKMDDGNWIMPGASVGGDNLAAVAISHGDDLTTWDLVVIDKHPTIGRMWGESAIVVDGSQVVNIARYGAKAQALAAFSADYGRTWTTMVESNLPMATSKPCAGMLSTGQRYLIGTTTADSGKRRAPLTIAVSRAGEEHFSTIFTIRPSDFPEGPGESHPKAGLAYPYATEHAGKLYVGYSNSGGGVGRTGQGRAGWNNNSAEMAVIPLESLALD